MLTLNDARQRWRICGQVNEYSAEDGNEKRRGTSSQPLPAFGLFLRNKLVNCKPTDKITNKRWKKEILLSCIDLNYWMRIRVEGYRHKYICIRFIYYWGTELNKIDRKAPSVHRTPIHGTILYLVFSIIISIPSLINCISAE